MAWEERKQTDSKWYLCHLESRSKLKSGFGASGFPLSNRVAVEGKSDDVNVNNLDIYIFHNLKI